MGGRIRRRRQGGTGHVGGHRGIQIATLEGDDVQEFAQGHQAQGQLAGLVGHHHGVFAALTDGVEHLAQGRGRGHHQGRPTGQAPQGGLITFQAQGAAVGPGLSGVGGGTHGCRSPSAKRDLALSTNSRVEKGLGI